MSVSTASEVSVSKRLEALKAKHRALSQQVDDAQKRLSTSDYYLNQLKKQKLFVKEKLADEERRVAG